jgi:ABC-type amino acid transport substrate-binding protein
MQDPDQIKSSVPDIKRLISEYPHLALPVGVFISLLGLATIIKTLIQGFTWAHEAGGIQGVIWALGGSIVVLVIAITIINRALRPRPEIEGFPTPYFSKSPTIKWTYKEPKKKKVTYQITVKDQKAGDEYKPINGPQKMYHAVLRDRYGELTITVKAMVNNKPYRVSRKFSAEIYKDAVQRITLTGKIRVAVHHDPGEEIFCYYWDDKWQGFDIDFVELIANELRSDLGLKDPIEVEYLFYPWPQVISAPNEYEVDFAIASISISAERAKEYNIMFSKPYSESQQGIVASANGFDGNINSPIPLDSLIGKTIAFHKETTASSMVGKMKQDPRYKESINFQVAENNDELRAFLKNGTVDGVINDYQRAFSLLDQGMFVQYLDHNIDIAQDLYGITFAKISTRLRENVDRIIERKQNEIRELLDERIRHHYRKFQHESDREVSN